MPVGVLPAPASMGAPCRRLQETRRAYRELFYTADIGGSISGAIMFKETLQQSASDGRSFVRCLGDQGVLPGVKVDEVRPVHLG